MTRAQSMVSHFKNSSARDEKYAAICARRVAAAAAASPYKDLVDLGPMIEDDYCDDAFSTDDVEASLSSSTVDAYLLEALDIFAAEITDEELQVSPETARIVKLVSCVQTRCWSVVSMLQVIFSQRSVNTDYAIENDEFKNLDIADYKDVGLMLGAALAVAQLERFLEGEDYNTLTVARPLCLQVYDYISGIISCPTVTNPDGQPFSQDAFSTGVPSIFLRNMKARALQTITSEMAVPEAIAIILDSRIKASFLETMATRFDSPFSTYWADLLMTALRVLKQRLVDAMVFDQARVEKNSAMRAAEKKTANEAAATEEDDDVEVVVVEPSSQLPKRRKIGLAAAMVYDRSLPASAPAELAAVVRNAVFFATTAHNDVEEYLKSPMTNIPLFPDDDKEFFDPADAWISGTCVPQNAFKKLFLDGAHKKHSYIAASACAYLGGHASAARPERLFRDVRFLNGVFQQRMKPATISRRSMLKKNKNYLAPVKEIIATYNNNHPNTKARGSAQMRVTQPPQTDVP